MKIVSAEEMRAIDRVTSDRCGVPALTLMENAGTAVAEFVAARYPSARRIGVICGKGNNGGDGFVVARKLHEAGKEVRVLLLAEPSQLRGDAAEMFARLPVAPGLAPSASDLKAASARAVFDVDVLVDAMLGTGFHPPVSGLYAEAIHALNATSVPIIAVDIPSGADADVMGEQVGSVARADAVVSFTAPRPAHVFGTLTRGPTVICPIGSPDDAIASALQLNLITARQAAPLIGPRSPAANKGNFGHVLVLGGSLGKAGAAAMAGMASLRAGAGLSTVATPRSVLATVAGFHPELMTEPLAETRAHSISLAALARGRMDALVQGKTVLAVGPGVSRHPETAKFVRGVVRKYAAPTVLDADGLNAFAGHTPELKQSAGTLVLTPHPGEMARLVGSTVAAVQRDRLSVARAFAHKYELIVVLKGHHTLITEPDGAAWVNTTGNPGMATAGTGDLLTGMVAGFIAQHPDRMVDAVIAAVYLHGLAGDVAHERMGEHSLVATDLLQALPEAFRRTRQRAQEAWVTISA
jgi:NAD(P)H-hydrate epimerase